MGNQGLGGPGGGRNPFGQMSEEEKKKARERRQEECRLMKVDSYLYFQYREA